MKELKNLEAIRELLAVSELFINQLKINNHYGKLI